MSHQFKENGPIIPMHSADAFWDSSTGIPRNTLNVIAGLRFDYFSESNVCAISLPHLGLMYMIGKTGSLRGSYYAAGVPFAHPRKEMHMNSYMANTMTIYGNPDLEPETSHNFARLREIYQNRYNFTPDRIL
ncbi:MAG: TonB-dependent receptor domain-containing protein [Parabacteroides distasonis]